MITQLECQYRCEAQIRAQGALGSGRGSLAEQGEPNGFVGSHPCQTAHIRLRNFKVLRKLGVGIVTFRGSTEHGYQRLRALPNRASTGCSAGAPQPQDVLWCLRVPKGRISFVGVCLCFIHQLLYHNFLSIKRANLFFYMLMLHIS